MEAIHGITFTDYAATNAFLAQGKELKELLPVLGIEEPQWDEASKHWENAMRNDDDFKLVSIFGDVFQNPAQGKLAGLATQTSDDVLRKIPTLEKYIEIQEMMSVAATYGIDAQAFLLNQGITIMDYSQSGMHWMKVQNESMSPANPYFNDFVQWFSGTHQYYKEKFEQEFAQLHGGKLGSDIEF
ncbi:DUF6620 family protein [Chitinophagaceae bacterium MMS25-I14]